MEKLEWREHQTLGAWYRFTTKDSAGTYYWLGNNAEGWTLYRRTPGHAHSFCGFGAMPPAQAKQAATLFITMGGFDE